MKRIIIACLIVVALILTSFTSVVTAESKLGQALAGWWLFDEGSGTLAADSSGMGNDGTLHNGIIFTTDALLGSAVDFIGDSGQVAIGHSPAFEPVTGTIEAWIKIAVPQQADIVRKTTDLWVRTNISGGFSVYGLRIKDNGSAYGFVGNDDPDAVSPWTLAISPPGLVTPHEWHHLAMRWDGNTVATFVDGVLRAETPYDPVPGTGLSYHGGSPLYLGVLTSGGGEFIGQMDDVRFYGTARSDVEIFTDFKSRGHKPAKPLGK